MADSTENRPGILVVDDSRLMRVAARKILKSDFEVLEAEDGEVAWESLQSGKEIDIVMSDLSMPNLDGLGLLQRIRQSSDERIRQLPVVIVTGAEDDNGSKETALAAGASDFITKPFESVQLLARANAHVKQQRTQQALKQSEENSGVDALTGLLNSHQFEQRVDESVSYAVRHDSAVSILAIQIDRYKILFLRRGKRTAESLLCHIAEQIGAGRRREDVVARVGMDSFAVLLPSATPGGALRAAQQVFDRLQEQCFATDGENIPFTLSMAVAGTENGMTATAAELLAMTAERLRLAQSEGGNRIYREPAITAPEGPSAGETGGDTHQPANTSPQDVLRALEDLENGRQPSGDMDQLVRATLPLLWCWAGQEGIDKRPIIEKLQKAVDSRRPAVATQPVAERSEA